MPPAAFRMGSPTPSNTEDTELQVVVVGAGRADLVAQTKVGPLGRETHRWGWNAAHQMGRISQEISKKSWKTWTSFQHQSIKDLWWFGTWILCSISLIWDVILNPLTKSIIFHFFSKMVIAPPTRICIRFCIQKCNRTTGLHQTWGCAGTALELASWSVKYGLKWWDFLPKKTGLSSLDNHEFPRS